MSPYRFEQYNSGTSFLVICNNCSVSVYTFLGFRQISCVVTNQLILCGAEEYNKIHTLVSSESHGAEVQPTAPWYQGLRSSATLEQST